MGKRRSSKQLKQEAAAFHEAGHAVMARHVGLVIAEVFIDPEELPRCRTMAGPGWEGVNVENLYGEAKEAYRQHIEHKVMMLMAGRLAQRRHVPHAEDPEHFSQEIDVAAQVLVSLTPEIRDLTDHMRQLHKRVQAFLRKPEVWAQVTALAELLLKGRPISSAQIYSAMILAEQKAKRPAT